MKSNHDFVQYSMALHMSYQWHWWRGLTVNLQNSPDSKVHGANMGSIWVLSAPFWPHEPCYRGHNIPCPCRRATERHLRVFWIVLILYILCMIYIILTPSSIYHANVFASVNSSPLVPHICVGELDQHWFR